MSHRIASKIKNVICLLQHTYLYKTLVFSWRITLFFNCSPLQPDFNISGPDQRYPFPYENSFFLVRFGVMENRTPHGRTPDPRLGFSASSGPGSSPGRGHSAVFLGKTLHSHIVLPASSAGSACVCLVKNTFCPG